MIGAPVLAAIEARLTAALAPPRERYHTLIVDGASVGWLDDSRAARIALFHDVFTMDGDGIAFVPSIATPDARTAALGRVCTILAGEGRLTAWRDERYAVARTLGATPLFLIERAAARFFGIRTYAVHVNGLIRRDEHGVGALAMWIARRSPHKAIDPGLLDNLVGGGIAAGSTVRETLAKEAREEAGIALSLAHQAKSAGAVHLCRAQPDGLQRETIFVHDLFLPHDLEPLGQDDEVIEHRLVSIDEVARLVANSEESQVVTADASLVIVDCLIRRGVIAPDSPQFAALEALRHPLLQPVRQADE